ncbi:MAG: glycosyl hydrolase family 18 protein [Xenococcus sp. (in: cyanobacteria)]
MGLSSDYADSNIPEWSATEDHYDAGAVVKHNNNIFIAGFWTNNEPGEAGSDPGENSWRIYDELYDQTSTPSREPAKIIAYIPAFKDTDEFDHTNEEMYQYITHGIVSFLTFRDDNSGEFDQDSKTEVEAILPEIVEIAHRKGTYISIALGGADDFGFQHLMREIGDNPDDPRLDQITQNVVNFVDSNNLDGVDLDLECWWNEDGTEDPGQGGRDKVKDGPHPAGTALKFLAQKLREALPTDNNKLISAAVFGTSWYGNNYDSEMVDSLDWLGIMTYDLTGSWKESPVGPHSHLIKIQPQNTADILERDVYQESYLDEQQGEWPAARQPATEAQDEIQNKDEAQNILDNPIFSVEDSLWYWTNPLFLTWNGQGQNVPRHMIAGGVPIYGYDFAYGKEENEYGIVAPGYKFISYKEILAQDPDAHTNPDGHIKVDAGAEGTPRPPFLESVPGNYPYANNIYYETPDAAVTKLDLLMDVGTQGVIIWELSQDSWNDVSKSIIKALYLRSGNPETRPPIISNLEAVLS